MSGDLEGLADRDGTQEAVGSSDILGALIHNLGMGWWPNIRHECFGFFGGLT